MSRRPEQSTAGSLLPRPEFHRRDSCFEPGAVSVLQPPESTSSSADSRAAMGGVKGWHFTEHKVHWSRLTDARGGRVVDGRRPGSSAGRARQRSPPPAASSSRGKSRSPPPPPSSIRVMATTFNVGNAKVNDGELAAWLSKADGCDLVVVALQEANYLSTSQKRGLAMLAGFTLLGAATGGTGVVAGLAAGATVSGAMAVHSHVMPKLRQAMGGGHSSPSPHPHHHHDDDDDKEEEEEETLGGGGHHDEDEDDDSSRDGDDQDDESSSPSFPPPRSPAGPTKKGMEGTPMLASAIMAAIDRHMTPMGFERQLASHGQMRLAVYTRLECACVAKKHGMGMAMNKGGLQLQLRLKGLDLCFVGVHLPAHEGKRKERTEALEEIFDVFEPSGDAVFLLGDLNYRLARHDETNLEFQPVVDLLKKSRLQPLHDADELITELVGLDPTPALRGFATPSCDFMPTFKMKRGLGAAPPPPETPTNSTPAAERPLGDESQQHHHHHHLRGGTTTTTTKKTLYKSKRCPAWCDRVLFRLPNTRLTLAIDEYQSCPFVTTSDHKPVYLLATIHQESSSNNNNNNGLSDHLAYSTTTSSLDLLNSSDSYRRSFSAPGAPYSAQRPLRPNHLERQHRVHFTEDLLDADLEHLDHGRDSDILQPTTFAPPTPTEEDAALADYERQQDAAAAANGTPATLPRSIADS